MGRFSLLLSQLCLSHYCRSDLALAKHADSLFTFFLLPLLDRNSLQKRAGRGVGMEITTQTRVMRKVKKCGFCSVAVGELAMRCLS